MGRMPSSRRRLSRRSAQDQSVTRACSGARRSHRDRVAQSSQAQSREAFEIVVAPSVTVALHLVEEHVADAVDGALYATPEFQWIKEEHRQRDAD